MENYESENDEAPLIDYSVYLPEEKLAAERKERILSEIARLDKND